MADDQPDGEEYDPGRKLMITALVGIAVLTLLTILALIYVAWRAAEEQGAVRGPGPDSARAGVLRPGPEAGRGPPGAGAGRRLGPPRRTLL